MSSGAAFAAWLRDRRVVVFGLAKSGQAAARLLRAHGARLTGVDEGAAAASVLQGEWGRSHLEVAASEANPDLLHGIELFVLSPGIPAVHPFVQAARAAHIEVISEIELAYRCCAAPVVAITGSKGKSTTTALTGALLKAQGKAVAVAGNIGLPFSAVVEGLGADAWIVLELSSFQLETIDTLHARCAVLLGVSPDHLDRYPDLDAYAAAKMRIGRHQDAGDWLVVDPHDRYGAMLARRSVARVVGFDREWQGLGVVRDGADLVWRDGPRSEVLCRVADVPLLGGHNLRNAMAALAVARSLGPIGDAERAALRRFEALPYRMQPAGEVAGIRFVNDSKGTTPDAVAAGVEGLEGTILLGMGGRNKGLDFSVLRPHLSRVRAAVLLGEAAPEIESALGGGVPVHRVPDLDAMVARGLEIGAAGDTFLFSPGCTSFDMFHNAEERGAAFDAAVRRARARVQGVGRT